MEVSRYVIIIFNYAAGLYANVSKNSSNLFMYYISFISPLRYSTELLLRRTLDGKETTVVDATLNYFGYS
jgi:hypothetical protein